MRSDRVRTASVALAAAATAGGLVAGCGSSGGGRAAVQVAFSGTAQQLAVTSVSSGDVSRAQSAFGLDLLAHRCRTAPAANDLLSPTSAAIALTMLDTGAVGATRDRVSRMLHLPAWNTPLLAALQQQHADLTALRQVRISNHVYAAAGVQPQQRVVDELATTQGADLQTLDFAGAPGAATDTINAQVRRDTKGLIKALFDSPLDRDTVTVLTNAIHLDAQWETPFAVSSDGSFRRANGTTTRTPFLSHGGSAGVRTVNGWTSATVGYQGKQLQAVVLLPPPGSPACTLPSAAQMNALSTGPSEEGELSMPKLNLTQTSDLLSDLKALGLPIEGDYSGLLPKGFGGGTAVSRVVQKTVLDVNAKGTKAAAATGVAVEATAARDVERVIADRPYLLLIEDTTTHAPLFLARIADPAAG